MKPRAADVVSAAMATRRHDEPMAGCANASIVRRCFDAPMIRSMFKLKIED
jgi:hypothetical protein